MLLRLTKSSIAKLAIRKRVKLYKKFGIELNAEWYARLNSDVEASKVDPLKHFFEHGIIEGRAIPASFSSYWISDFVSGEEIFRVNSKNVGKPKISIFVDCRNPITKKKLDLPVNNPLIKLHLVGNRNQVFRLCKQNNLDVEAVETKPFLDICEDFFMFVAIGDYFTDAVSSLGVSESDASISVPVQFPLTGRSANRSIIGHCFISSKSHCGLLTLERSRVGHDIPRRIFGTTLRGTLIPRSYASEKLGPGVELADIVRAWNSFCWNMKFEGISHILIGKESVLSNLELPRDEMNPNILVELPQDASNLISRFNFSNNIGSTKFSNSSNVLVAPQDRFSELPWDDLVDRVVSDLAGIGISVLPLDGNISENTDCVHLYFYSEFDFMKRLLPTGSDGRKLFMVKQGVCNCAGVRCEQMSYRKSPITLSNKWRDTSPSNQVIFIRCDENSHKNNDLLSSLTTLKVFPIITDR